jgi:glycine/D-amino acid oxidase-like deaminating enzyme
VQHYDVAVIGAGMVGAAVACGLVWRGAKVVALDGGDGDFRASRANFGLVWLQGKGLGLPAYQRLTGRSVEAWSDLATRLGETSGIDVHFQRRGSLVFCLGETELEARRTRLSRLQAELGGDEPDFQIMSRRDLEQFLPGVRLGERVSGASLRPRDGHVNPLRLLAGLQRSFTLSGGTLRCGQPVSRLQPSGDGFIVEAGDERFAAARLVVSAGIASGDLSAPLGLTTPVRPQRGQLLVTERLAPMLPMAASGLRQTTDGTFMIGLTNEEVGPDTSVTVKAATSMSRRAVAILPDLARATVVRHWAGLRVMTPDGFPIYAQSEQHPGAFVVTCHSGVALAAAHAGEVAAGIVAGKLPAELSPFHNGRFDVPKAA